jgi:hypothetical protein
MTASEPPVIEESEIELLQLLPVPLATQDRSDHGIQAYSATYAPEVTLPHIVVGCSAASR